MNPHILIHHKIINILQSIALVFILAGMVSYLSLLIGGQSFAILGFTTVLLMYILNPGLTPQFILRMYNAQPLDHVNAPAFVELLAQVAQQAGLSHLPKLYYVPSEVINAFTVGSEKNAVIAVSHGLIQKLTYSELAGIFAHEISHIKNKDIRIMMFADIAGRFTKLLSLFGQLLILVNLPLSLLTDMDIPWWPLFVMIVAPLLSDLIQLGLSRIREYNADLGSAMIIGDARPLISALQKVEYYNHSYMASLFMPFRKISEPSLLRTHPMTEERIRRLKEFHQTTEFETNYRKPVNYAHDLSDKPIEGKKVESPRRRYTGFWY